MEAAKLRHGSPVNNSNRINLNPAVLNFSNARKIHIHIYRDKMQASPKNSGKVGMAPDQTGQELIGDFLSRMPLADRWAPIAGELKWVLGGCQKPNEHKKILPSYCYEILDVWRRTLFKNLPSYNETVFVTGTGKSAKARIDWRNMGKIISIGERGARFFDLEAMPLLKADGLLDLKPEKEEKALKWIFGDRWLEKKLLRLILRPRSEEHTSELQSPCNLVCRLLLEKNKI